MRCFTTETTSGLKPSGSQRHRRQRGVVLVIMLLAIVLIASLLYYVINLGKHVNNRIVAQHSADAAANAQGTWIARQFNTVAMNNVTITRYLAAIPVMDCQPLIAEAQYNEYRRLLDGLQETYNPNTGRNSISSNNTLLDAVLTAELVRLHTEMMSEQQQLYDVYNQFLQYDITQDTRYPGNIWDAMHNLNEISLACLDGIATMPGLHAADVGRANMEADNSSGT
ncbi:MAG: TadE/TadG family type IV pilus assembly protein, partial [Phycisphaeraceae bacterium JB051]